MALFGIKLWQVALIGLGGFVAMDYGIKPYFEAVQWLGRL